MSMYVPREHAVRLPDIIENMHYPRELNYLRDHYPCEHFVCPILCSSRYIANTGFVTIFAEEGLGQRTEETKSDEV